MHEHSRRSAWLAALILSTPALAAEPPSGSIAVVRAWSRATAPGASVGVAYFEITNPGPADVLVSIETPVAQSVEMHSMTTVGGVMQMRPIPSVNVPAGGRILFQPGGLHAMLIDLNRPMKEGQRFPLTFVFRQSGRMRVEVIVQGFGALAPPAAKAPGDEQHN